MRRTFILGASQKVSHSAYDDNKCPNGQTSFPGDYFKQRSWKGLDDSVRVDEDTSVTEGLAGIAASYATEPSK